jgi:hypothetical protein
MGEKKSNSQKNNAKAPASAEKSAESTTIKQKLFILKAKSKNLKNAEQFLKNRDFEVVSTTDMKVAISTILSGQASVIMLSADHTNPKVLKLPQIIQQSFNPIIIIFSEGVSQKGIAALRECRHPYVLYPPVSGPAVERMILKIEREKKEKLDAEKKEVDRVVRENSHEHGTMKFSGTVNSNDADIIMQAKTVEKELAEILSGDSAVDSSFSDTQDDGEEDSYTGFAQGQSTHGSHATQDDASDVRNYLNQDSNDPASEGSSGEIRGPGYAGTHRAPGAKGPGTRAQGESESEDSTNGIGAFSPSGQGSQSGINSQSSTTAEVNESEGNQDSEASRAGLPKFVGMNRKGDKHTSTQGEDDHGHQSSFEEAGGSKSHVTKPVEVTREGELTPAEILSKKGLNILTFKADDNASFLIKGTKHAVENTARYVQGKKVSKIQSCTKVSCFKVEASKFSGFVIVAFGEKDKIDVQFNKNIQTYLCEYLKINGLEVNTGDLQELKLKEVNFEEWSVREADFLMTSIHEGNEIALAFFPQEKRDAPLELSAQADMAKMTIDEIKADEPVEFDVYIHLPTNNKYVRYTPKNGTMYSSQKNRLKSGGHAKIHIRKESESDLSRYRVQNFLNDKIENFKKSKKSA